MINKRPMWTVVFNTLVDPCVIIDMLAGVWVGEVIEMLVEVFVIDVRFSVVIDTLSGVSVVVITYEGVSDVGAELLTDMKANSLIAAMTALGFVVSSPLEESMSFC